MNNFNEWSKSIYEELTSSPQKRIILIAGASGSGKSYNSQKLCEFLNSKKIPATVFSADNYYKGISRLLVEKVFLENPNLSKYKSRQSQIVKELIKIIENSPFTEKFCDKNFREIITSLKSIIGNDNVIFGIALKEQFKKIDFDEPFALNLNLLVEDINKLLNNQSIILPSYSFATGEVTLAESNRIDSNNNIFIIEGLYVLTDQVYGKLNANSVIPCLVNCDLKTLLSRRLNRDIKSGRTTYTPEQTIITTLTKTMPSYCKYIEPYNKNSKHTLNTSITTEEIISKESSSQLKFRLNNAQMQAIQALQLTPILTQNQIDHYLCDNSNQDTFILRVREENNIATKLTFKNNHSNTFEINRKIEEYDLSNFSPENRNINSFLQNIKNSGFKQDLIVQKNRNIINYGNCQFKLDNVNNLGIFIEFDELFDDAKKLINMLKLTDIQNMSYLELLKSKTKTSTLNQTYNKINIEKEYKFLIDKLPNIPMKKQSIIQFYFDFNNFKNYLLNINKNIDFNNVSSARVRKVKENGQIKYYLTLKSNGSFAREEQEFLIDEIQAKYLIKNSHSFIKKTRYKYNKNGIIFEFDKLSNGILLAEVEINNNIAYSQILQILKSLNIKFKDVTNNSSYKNQNLAQSIK